MTGAEMLPDLGEFLRLGLGELAELLHDPIGDALADGGEDRALLDHFARDVERQIGAVDDEADEAQPAGQDVGVLGDQHPPDVEFVAALAGRVEEVERPRAGDEGEHGIFVPALRPPVQRQRRLVELAREAAVEFGIVLGLHLRLGLRPDRRAVGDAARLGARLLDEVDRNGDGAGMIADDPLDLPGFGVVVRLRVEMEDDPGAARRRGVEGEGGDAEGALAVGRPAPGLTCPGGTRFDHDLVGDHEGRIEADAELADESRSFLARFLRRQPVEEGLGAGTGDGAEPLGQIVAAHADAVVRDGQRLGVGIEGDGDGEGRAVGDQVGPGDRLVAQLLAGVGGVGDELADENVAVGIDRVDHQMQKPRNVGLEALRRRGFGRRGLGVGGQVCASCQNGKGTGRASKPGRPRYRRLAARIQDFIARRLAGLGLSAFRTAEVAMSKNLFAEIHRMLAELRPQPGRSRQA